LATSVPTRWVGAIDIGLRCAARK